MTRTMRRLWLCVCVLLVLLLVYAAVQRNLKLTVIFGADTVSIVHETTTPCYGSAENLRHLILQDRFQVCLHCDFGLVYSVY